MKEQQQVYKTTRETALVRFHGPAVYSSGESSKHNTSISSVKVVCIADFGAATLADSANPKSPALVSPKADA